MSDAAGDLVALLSEWVEPGRILSSRRLAGGTYNNAYWVDIAGVGSVVVKVAPDPDKECLAYERDLMSNEIDFYRHSMGRGWSVPGLVAASRAHPARWLALEALTQTSPQGDPSAELGHFMAQLHRVTGTAFGYAHLEELQASSWSAAFTKMLTAVIVDAHRFDVALPVSGDLLLALTQQLDAELDAVAEPRLVHFDLWDGNLLHSENGLVAIDPERSFWGDPVAEFVSPALFVDLEARPGIRAAYRDAAGFDPLDHPSAEARRALYACYLYLIMLVEMTPRANADDGMRGFATARLVASADRLTKTIGT